ncbi:MAG: hypothetical protein WCY58_13990, partial [Mariniphaga sp.]|nr:hypothetical protein [Mariniphaga sp.]
LNNLELLFFAPLTPFFCHNFTKLKCQTVSPILFHIIGGLVHILNRLAYISPNAPDEIFQELLPNHWTKKQTDKSEEGEGRNLM